MKKIYIVTFGEYSEYTIEACFDKKKLAKKYIKGYPHYNKIEEHPLNPDIYKVKHKMFFVIMDKKGKVRHCEICYDRKISCKLDYMSIQIPGSSVPIGDAQLMVVCDAKDKTHAIKITNEKRVQLIANDTWDLFVMKKRNNK